MPVPAVQSTTRPPRRHTRRVFIGCPPPTLYLHFGGEELSPGVPDERGRLRLRRVSCCGKHLPTLTYIQTCVEARGPGETTNHTGAKYL